MTDEELKKNDERFIGMLRYLARDRGENENDKQFRERRTALARLRKALKDGREAIDAYRHVVPFLPDDGKEHPEYFLVAGLFGFHPLLRDTGNMGSVFWEMAAREKGGSEGANERRFLQLLNAHSEQLPFHLRRVVMMAKTGSSPVAIPYRLLLDDIRHWDHPRGYVQRRWAERYYRSFKEASQSDGNTEKE